MTTQAAVLQVGPLLPFLADTLHARYGAAVLPEGQDADAFLAERGTEFLALVTSGRSSITPGLMGALPHLEAIINFGVGYDTIDVAAAEQRGIQVSNTPGVLDDCVADTAVGLLIDVLRGFSASDRFVRRGEWPAQGAFPLTRRVTGSKIGILGLGRIGLAIAHRLEAFDAEIRYHNRRERTDVRYDYADSLIELATWSDVLIVVAAGGDATRGLVSARVLDALGPDGYLINIARGSLVDEPALVAALTAGRLAGAGLDVFADEPRVPKELLTLDTVVLTPHVASATEQTRRAMAELALQNLARFLEDGTLVTPVR